MQNYSHSLAPLRFGREARYGQQRHDHETQNKSQEHSADKYREGHGNVSLSFKLHEAMSAGSPENQSRLRPLAFVLNLIIIINSPKANPPKYLIPGR
jgi:hypothetical protein